MAKARSIWALVAIVLAAAAPKLVVAQEQTMCMLSLQIASQQSPWSGKGDIVAPFPATITSVPLKAAGKVYVNVPTTSGCPPEELSAANATSLFERASLMLPINDSSITFNPVDIHSNVTAVDALPGSAPRIKFDFNKLGLGLTGNEPFGPGSVKLGTGSAAEAKATAQPVCAQLVSLAGVLNLTSLLGPRTADVKDVAYNRSTNIGVSLKKAGDNVTSMTLFMGNASLFLNISPETVPGVEITRGKYLLSGNVVATAMLDDVRSWQTVPLADADWSTVQRQDNPVVLGGNPAYPKFYGLNATTPPECTAKRALSASGALTAAAPTADTSRGTDVGGTPAKGAAESVRSSLCLIAAGAVAALATML